jgi:hypothetical protein
MIKSFYSLSCTFLLLATFGVTNAQWQYRTAITVNSTGTELVDFQVMVTLDKSNFNYSYINEDGSDIRFSTDSSWNFLPNINYWIETIDTSDTSKIWIKVPAIPVSGEIIIHMFYGNPSANSESDGMATFELFDDFEGTSLDTSKWSEFGSGSVSVQDSYIRFTQANNDFDKGIITDKISTLSSYKIKSAYRLIDNESIFQIQHKITNNPGTYHVRSGMTSTFNGQDNSIAVGHSDDGGVHSNDSSSGYTLQTDLWYTGEAWFSGSTKYTIQDKISVNSSDNIYNNDYLTLCVFSRNNSTPRVDVDWVFVRKYTDPEPIATVGKHIVLSLENIDLNNPGTFGLSQNYPNPFNPSTNIEYSIPSESFVELKVYDVLGNEVASLVNEQQQAGVYRVDFSADNLPSGMYFARITANEFTQVVKMILLK